MTVDAAGLAEIADECVALVRQTFGLHLDWSMFDGEESKSLATLVRALPAISERGRPG